jgi:hypothetical protein
MDISISSNTPIRHNSCPGDANSCSKLEAARRSSNTSFLLALCEYRIESSAGCLHLRNDVVFDQL